MIQWGKPIFFSLGIHIDCFLRYVDFHLIFLIITIGKTDYDFDTYEINLRSWWASRTKD